ncbi:hypothetical protein CBP51_12935 [Cellvibrio mixtus]|uniref:PhoD-like phosphatase metallophosphatase domain-containing protein n=1 Tax=Cellvibrio mixtus TaxID=39650 RepID=A0A266QEN4_9GAMM|nr:alkaline phosphatase D family protein [Cellvibrio mixtus]OZY87821.1 hypothetical protein CBP51_12935 [Cellvibrio mixtus]
MQLFAYNPVGKPDALVVWVGVLGVNPPPTVSFEILGQAVSAQLLAPGFEPLGDEVCDARGVPLNYRALFVLPWPATGERFHITVRAANQQVTLTSRRPPVQLPDKATASFNLLLSSCYYQPNDKSRALADLVKAIKPAPDFTVLAGDQVYLDLPSQQDLPLNANALAKTLGKKYQLNWFSNSAQQPGLADVLRHGPVLCVPDDHEFWNNYPLPQAQLNNTYCPQDRANWQRLANCLYERYQRSPAQVNGFFRQDIAPLSMLFLDGRTQRDSDGTQMFTAATHAAIEQWKQDLLTRKQQGQSAVGLLSSGQALLIETPGPWACKITDMEMPNYADFALITKALGELFAAGIPVIYITGDVHWGRIVEGKTARGNPLFYEVIASPSRLIDTNCVDQYKLAKNALHRLFGKGDDFPCHPAVCEIDDIKFSNLRLTIKHRQRGDHVALLRFHAIPGGIEFSVDYVCTEADETRRREYSKSCGPFKLTSL